mmetsp:Transcript_17532/g.16751  ORF Transcript_17532/g.16751 Transcript_17532/m.16751 type:complete len:109 (+) Transcript_17532:428-754(+)
MMQGFTWRGVVVLNLKQLNCSTGLTDFKAKFMLSLKGKERFLRVVRGKVDEIIKAHGIPGIYFKVNQQEILTRNFVLESSSCGLCGQNVPQGRIYYMESEEGPKYFCE